MKTPVFETIEEFKILIDLSEGDTEYLKFLLDKKETELLRYERSQLRSIFISGMEFIAVTPEFYEQDADKFLNQKFNNYDPS